MSSTQPILGQPNVFQLQGSDASISYSTTSFLSIPEFIFNRQGQTLTFKGRKIQTEGSQLGQLVTVDLNDASSATSLIGALQAEFETLTLLIPIVNISPKTKQSSIKTIAILSQRLPVKVGQSQTYETLQLSGTAEQIDF